MGRKDFFNEAAANWDKRFNNQNLTTFLETLPKFELKKGQNILDAGAGTGILFFFLLNAVGSKGHITAIDYAEKMIETCKTKYLDFPKVTFIVEDIEGTSLPSQSFDAVVCFGLFPHLEHKKQALNQLNRLLKQGGKLVIAHALSREQINSHHARIPSVACDILPTVPQMKEMLKQTGFIKVEIVNIPNCYLCTCIKE